MFSLLPPGFLAVPHYLGHELGRPWLLAEPDLVRITIRLPVCAPNVHPCGRAYAPLNTRSTGMSQAGTQPPQLVVG